jgi:hypothetical protein
VALDKAVREALAIVVNVLSKQLSRLRPAQGVALLDELEVDVQARGETLKDQVAVNEAEEGV